MKNNWWKTIQPHAIAVGIFLIVTIFFCSTAFQSNMVLKQADTASWQAMAQQSSEYAKAHNGKFPLWVTSMFSGMPAFQVAIAGPTDPLSFVSQLGQLWMPAPAGYLFLACIGFYFLCMMLRIRPWVGVFAALAYAYCTYNLEIIPAGHVTKMWAIGWAPFLLGAIVLLYRGNFKLGFPLAAVFAAAEIGAGHQQISYYLFLVIGIFTISSLYYAFKEKTQSSLIKAIGLAAIAGVLGVAVHAVSMIPTYEYAKESKRGGQLVMDSTSFGDHNKVVDGKTQGMSKEYAFQWSLGQGETFSLMFPGASGYGFTAAEKDGDYKYWPMLPDDSKILTKMSELPPIYNDDLKLRFSQSVYWGKQPFTSGPVYLGAIVCFLFILGLFIAEGKYKWWILACTILGIVLSWGHNFADFNNFMFDYFPLYKNFRVPTMALFIPQLLVPILAAITLNKIADRTDVDLWKKFVRGSIATAVVFALAFVYYFSADFSNENRQRTTQLNQLLINKDPDIMNKLAKYEPTKDNLIYEEALVKLGASSEAQTTARGLLNALQQDRASFFMKSIGRTLLFVLLAAALIALYLKRKISELVMVLGIAALSTIDLLSLGSHYLNSNHYTNKEDYHNEEYPLTAADQQILQDKDPNYRVFDMSSGDPFQNSKASYYHKSIGGYHAAKLGIYDDLTAHQLSGQPNMQVINMLNTKYVIQKAEDGKVVAMKNDQALGNAWFVKGITWVNGPVEEMKAMNHFNAKDTAIVDQKFKTNLDGIVAADSSASIKQTEFDNDRIVYSSNSNSKNLAVFSEIYYKDWKAYIDGKETPIVKVNYVLRALPIPAGTHKIEFKFVPKVYFTSYTVSAISRWLVLGILLLGIFWAWKDGNKNKTIVPQKSKAE